MKIRNKLTIVCCVILIITILSLAVAVYTLYSYFFTNTSYYYTIQIVDQLNSNLKDRFSLMDSLASQVLLDSEVFQYLCNAENVVYDNRESLDQYYGIQAYLASLCSQNERIVAITLYCLGSNEVIASDKKTKATPRKWPFE